MSKTALLTPIHWDVFADGIKQQKEFGFSVFGSDDNSFIEIKKRAEKRPLDVYIYISSLEGLKDKIFGRGKLVNVFINPFQIDSEERFLEGFKQYFGFSFNEVKAGASEFGGEIGWEYYYALEEVKWLELPLSSAGFITSKGTPLGRSFVVRKPMLVENPN